MARGPSCGRPSIDRDHPSIHSSIQSIQTHLHAINGPKPPSSIKSPSLHSPPPSTLRLRRRLCRLCLSGTAHPPPCRHPISPPSQPTIASPHLTSTSQRKHTWPEDSRTHPLYRMPSTPTRPGSPSTHSNLPCIVPACPPSSITRHHARARAHRPRVPNHATPAMSRSRPATASRPCASRPRRRSCLLRPCRLACLLA